MSQHTEVLIIGGGVIGCSIAYELAKRGISNTIVERHRVASGATQAAAGMLAAQAEFIEHPALCRLAQKSRDQFPRLIEELHELTSIHTGYAGTGILRVAMDGDDVASFQQRNQLVADRHEMKWLSSTDAIALESELSPSIGGALLLPKDRQLQAPLYAAALAQAAIQLGTTILEYTNVERLLMKDGRVCGVQLADRTLYANHVVLVAGLYSSNVLNSIGLSLPLHPVKGECVAVRHVRRLLQHTVYTNNGYLVPKTNGEIIIGATVIPNSYELHVSADSIVSLLSRAAELIPAIEEAAIVRTWAGLRPETATRLPYIGAHPDLEQLWIAAGHYRNGILLSPITAEIIADSIEHRTSQEELSAFRVPSTGELASNMNGRRLTVDLSH